MKSLADTARSLGTATPEASGRPAYLRSCLWSWVLGVLSSTVFAAAQDLGSLPWLDKPIGRFFSPTYHGEDPWSLGDVLGDLVKQARIRASLEYQASINVDIRTIGAEDLHIAVASATPRRVLSEMAVRWAIVSPIQHRQFGDFLCLGQQVLWEDDKWPLNLEHVSGFSGRDKPFDGICSQAVSAIRSAYGSKFGSKAKWQLEWVPPTSDRSTGFGREGETDAEPLTAEIKAGPARDILCQVAMLRPNCFWGVVGDWDLTSTEQGREIVTAPRNWRARVKFATWGNWHHMPTGKLVAKLVASIPEEDWWAVDETMEHGILRELRSRGRAGALAMVEAYRAAKSEGVQAYLLGAMEQLCAWPDATAVIEEFWMVEKIKHPPGRLETGMEVGIGGLGGAIELAHELEKYGRVSLSPEEDEHAKEGVALPGWAIGLLLLAALSAICGLGCVLIAQRRARGRGPAQGPNTPRG